MSIQSILLLSIFTIALAVVTRNWQRINLLLAASVLLLFWLQPASTLRYAGFWLPCTSLGLIVLSWAATAQPAVRRSRLTWWSLLLITVLVVLAASFDRIDPSHLLGFNPAPGIFSAILFMITLTCAGWLLIQRKGGGLFWSWAAFGVLLVLLIVLKTPVLAQKASLVWRILTGQSQDLARASELQWLGYSYIAFRLLHTIRDRQTGRLPDIALNEYVAYVIFYPSLVAGPIARTDQVLAGLKQPPDDLGSDLLAGSQRLVAGLFKKFVLADSLAVFALNPLSANQAMATAGSWVLLYAYSLQIYLDFSGYTDIAIGLGQFLGVKLPENFNRPYLKPNLTQFWSNWHMTLTNWFRAYFFNPISRSLRKRKLPALAILLITQVSTMVLVGLWHGITLNFVLWGLWHGLGLLIQNRWSNWVKRFLPPPDQRPILQKTLEGLGAAVTFQYVTLGWIWFVLPSPDAAWQFFLHLFGVG